MPTITPASIPTKAPGTLFSSLSGGDPTLNIRWLVATDPCFYEVLNRPLADLTVRQLVLAKAIDTLTLAQGHNNLYPYLIQPRVSSGTAQIDVPIRWIWDMHASLPKKWENLRLAKIKRISGTNSPTEGYTGELRIILTANVENSPTEVSIFSADYRIDSFLTYQPIRLTVVDSTEETTPIDPTERETVAGFLIFRTLPLDEQDVQAFLDLMAPPVDTADTNSDGYYDNPAVYEIADSPVGGDTIPSDYSTVPISHGTGLLTDSAWNPIPNLDTDVQSWIDTFNYPFDTDATLISEDAIKIPRGLFREFNITGPAGDQPTDDTSGLFFPVWVSRIERVTDVGDRLRFYFSTYNVTDTAPNAASNGWIEFASMDLLQSGTPNQIVSIIPIKNLMLQAGADANDFIQHFGRGHVVLSSVWNKLTTDVDDFFNEFLSLVGTPADTIFPQASTRLSSYGVSRVPKYVPTIGQSRALRGSSSRRTVPLNPGYDNLYVTEADQGIGDQVDLDATTGITPNVAIERYGYTGALGHRIVRLVVDATAVGTNPTFYDVEILPRLTILLGRPPAFGDFWWNGTRIMFFNGDTFQG
jgi:hypothetical protein